MSKASSPGFSLGIVTGSMSRKAGGLFNSVRKSALNFHAKGVQVGVHALHDLYSEADTGAWAPLRPQVHATKGPASLGYAPSLDRALQSEQYDILHLHGIWQIQSLGVLRWKRKTGRPVMISPRGMLDPWALSNSGWKKKIVGALFENSNLRTADCLHALNASEAASMRKYGLTNPIAVIPNGTDMPDMSAQRSPNWSDRKTLLFLGRIHPKKGLAELIRGWSIAAKANPALMEKWQVVIAGWDDGGHELPLKTLTEELALSSCITFAGPVFDKAKDQLLRQADGFILPSFSEGLPVSVLEAWSYKLPVLMTEHCNLPEGIEKGAAVEISTNPEAMAEVLTEILMDDELGKFGDAGRALAEAEFAWSRIADRHIAVYDWLLGRGEQPDCVQLGA